MMRATLDRAAFANKLDAISRGMGYVEKRAEILSEIDWLMGEVEKYHSLLAILEGHRNQCARP